MMRLLSKHTKILAMFSSSKFKALCFVSLVFTMGGCHIMTNHLHKKISKENIFQLEPKSSSEEIFKELYSNKNIQIEKILSYGQTTPVDTPYIQDHDEWVLILDGSAKLKLDDKKYSLGKGESLLIPANTKHWVTYTYNPTIWLAIHIKD